MNRQYNRPNLNALNTLYSLGQAGYSPPPRLDARDFMRPTRSGGLDSSIISGGQAFNVLGSMAAGELEALRQQTVKTPARNLSLQELLGYSPNQNALAFVPFKRW